MTLWTDGSTVQLNGPPSYTGALPIVLGTPFPESVPLGGVALVVVPWASNIALQALSQYSDIQAMFREYQIVDSQFEFQFLNAGGYQEAVSCVVPELHIYTDPVDAIAPTSVIQSDAFSDCDRAVMTADRPSCYRTCPKPVQVTYESALASAYVDNDNVKDLWYSTQDIATPFYGMKGLFRNFSNNAAMGLVRISGVVTLRLRRPQ
jgi:hypothetical protein